MNKCYFQTKSVLAMMKSFAWLALSITMSSWLFGQKKFEVVLSFPETQVLTDLRIQIDNGLGRTTVTYKISDNNQVKLSDFYYSKYAAVVISCQNLKTGCITISFSLMKSMLRSPSCLQ